MAPGTVCSRTRTRDRLRHTTRLAARSPRADHIANSTVVTTKNNKVKLKLSLTRRRNQYRDPPAIRRRCSPIVFEANKRLCSFCVVWAVIEIVRCGHCPAHGAPGSDASIRVSLESWATGHRFVATPRKTGPGFSS